MSKKIYIETYGCQMNVGDSEVIFSILGKEGYERTESMDEADVILANTCSVRDIASLQMEEKDAEQMKINYASAYTDANEIDPGKTYPIDNDRSVEERKFVDIVEARVQEIVENVWCQVPNEYSDKLLGGIILTGGGANMKNIDRAFRNHTHVDKIRVAKFVSQTINSSNPSINAKDGTMCTILGLLAKGDMNCAGNEFGQDLFDNLDNHTSTVDTHRTTRNPNDTTGLGVVQTEEIKKKAEEEARRKKEQEEEEARRLAEIEAEEEAKRRKENSLVHKFMRGFKKFVKDTISEEE